MPGRLIKEVTVSSFPLNSASESYLCDGVSPKTQTQFVRVQSWFGMWKTGLCLIVFRYGLMEPVLSSNSLSAEEDLGLMIHLFLPPKCRDHRWAQLCPINVVLRDRTQGLTHTKQLFHQLSYIPSL